MTGHALIAINEFMSRYPHSDRVEDFKKINTELLRDVYQQVCLSDRDVEEIFVHLSSN